MPVGPLQRRQSPPLKAALTGVAMALSLALTACGAAADAPVVRVDPRSAPQPGTLDGGRVAAPPSYQAPSGGYGGQYAPGAGSAQSQRGNSPEGVAFANWVLSTDPDRQYIVDAYVRDDRVLGVIVNPNMSKGQVQQAMGSLMSGMQRTFPNRSLEVIAYYLSGDELARMTYDASSRQSRTTWRQ